MEFRRRTKKLSGLPIAFYVVGLLFFVLLFSFNSIYYKASDKPKPIIAETPKPLEEPKSDSATTPEIYVPEVEVLPVDTTAAAKPIAPETESKKEPLTATTEDKKQKTDEKKEKPEKEKITKIGKDRMLTAFIPGTMGKAGKLPAHNCKTKGQLVMYITVDKTGNLTSAGRSSGIKDACNVTAAVLWTKKFVKAKKSETISQGTYTIVF